MSEFDPFPIPGPPDPLRKKLPLPPPGNPPPLPPASSSGSPSGVVLLFFPGFRFICASPCILCLYYSPKLLKQVCTLQYPRYLPVFISTAGSFQRYACTRFFYYPHLDPNICLCLFCKYQDLTAVQPRFLTG